MVTLSRLVGFFGSARAASHDLTNVIYRGVAGKEKGGQGRAPSPYQLLLDKLVKSNLLCYTRSRARRKTHTYMKCDNKEFEVERQVSCFHVIQVKET